MNVSFSDFFKVPAHAVEKYGAFNISLLADLPLFVDPFLLFNSKKPAYRKLHDEMIRYLRFLRDKSSGANLDPQLIGAWYLFPEVSQNWLGFSKAGNKGRGLGRIFAAALHQNLGALFRDFGSEKVTKGSHLEKLCLIRDGVGTIVDLSIDDEQVRTISAARTLEALWRQGEARRKKQLSGSRGPCIGTLDVIDEGHMFAPPHTEDPRKQLVCERIKRFADQGKKLNLFLMVITQQPGKLHPDVLCEFNNRIILRVNERQSLTLLVGPCGNFSYNLDCKAAIQLVKPPTIPSGSPAGSAVCEIQSTLTRTCCCSRRAGL